VNAFSRILRQLSYVGAAVFALFLLLQVLFPEGAAAAIGILFFGLPAAALFALSGVVNQARGPMRAGQFPK
jgi:hypothetical protein